MSTTTFPSPRTPTTAPTPPSNISSSRLISLDALRGFDMFWIMGGDQLIRSLQKIDDSSVTRELSNQMEHCKWDGFHFYDLIFPLFVFLAGVSIVFSVTGMIERSGKVAALKRIAIRSAILFLLGIFYMGGVAHGFKNVYVAGVLHRIAVAYFFAAVLFCFFRSKTLLIITITLLMGYWALLTFVPVPGIGPASYDQGKNLAYYLDQHYLPGLKFEGTLLSTLAAIANCLLGVFAGLLLRNDSISRQKKVYRLFGAGITILTIGFIWSFQFPIIKLLWTSTYVLVACGFSAILLAAFYQTIEIWNYRKWAQPFIWIGVNAITIYIIASIANFRSLSTRFVGGNIKNLLGNYSDLAVALVTLIFVFSLVRFLYHREVFLRL